MTLNLRGILFVLLSASLLLVSASVRADVWWPGWKRAGWAFMENIKKPMVWAPAAAAGVFAATNADKAVSEWAVDNTPVFGSKGNADDWSNIIKTASGVAAAGTALAVPRNENTGKIKRLLLAPVTWWMSDTTVRIMKEGFDRERPNGSGNSFPSGHTNETFAMFTLASRNMHAIPVSDNAKLWADVGFYTMAGLGGWSRIEANDHWPSDVLFSVALGNFFAGFVYDWFVEDPESSKVSVNVSPVKDGMVLNLNYVL